MIVSDQMLTAGLNAMMEWGVDAPAGAIREAFNAMIDVHYLPPVAPGPYPVADVSVTQEGLSPSA